MGTLAKIRRLHLREGVPIKEIERRTGLARSTIKAWLRKDQMVEPKYPARVLASKLSGYTETLATWLKANAFRSKRERRTVLAMYEELVGLGYTGSYGRVAAFACHWRQKQAGSTGKAAFVPLKFALGEAFQFDWSTEYAGWVACAGAWKWPTPNCAPAEHSGWWPTRVKATRCCLTPMQECLPPSVACRSAGFMTT